MFETLDDIQKAMLNSMQMAICDLHASTVVPWINCKLLRRDEVLAKLGGRLSVDAQQSLREAPSPLMRSSILPCSRRL